MILPQLGSEGKCEGNESDASKSSFTTVNSSDSNFTPKEKNRRNRKNSDQIKVLLKEFEESSVWNKEFIKELSMKTGLSEAQIYKWRWDYKKKFRRPVSRFNDTNLICNEFLSPLQIDKDILIVQRLYKIGFSGFEMVSGNLYNK